MKTQLNLLQKNEDLRQVGKVIAAHGIKGEIYIRIFSGDLSWFSKVKTLKLDENSFVLKSFKKYKEGALLVLEGVIDRNTSEVLKGRMIWVPSEIFKSDESSNEFYLTEIENFEVNDDAIGKIGTIIGFSSNGAQDLLQIKTKSELIVEVPLVKEFIKEIDFTQKQIHMILPEGLLTINNEKNEI